MARDPILDKVNVSAAESIGPEAPATTEITRFTSDQVQLFNNALTNLLVKSQGLNTTGLRQKEQLLERESLRRAGAQTAGQETFLSPAQQAEIRGARVGATETERSLVAAQRQERAAQIGRLPQILSSLSQFAQAFAEPDEEYMKVGNQIIRIKGGEAEIIFDGKEEVDEFTTQQLFQNTLSLRKEYDNQSGDFIKVRDSFGRIGAAAKDPSAAGDLALIFNYMKILDPGSVVRESEFANAASTGAFGERLKAAGLKILQGQRLSPIMRADFVDRANRLYQSQLDQQNRLMTEFRSTATDFGLDPLKTAPDLVAGTRLEGGIGDTIEKGGATWRANADGTFTRIK